MQDNIKIAIFSSGSGSNAQKIIEYFNGKKDITVDILLANTPKAFALERAKNFGVATRVFDRQEFFQTDVIVEELQSRKINWIVLAGFLWMVPENIIHGFANKIINIHPALLPKYGGAGMYGANVHKAVIAAKDKVSGISIHLVNERYDEGEIIFQAQCELEEGDDADTVAKKVLALEHEHFAKVIEYQINKSIKNGF